MPQSRDSFSYSCGTFSQFDHTLLAEAHANWKDWKPVMHSVVLGHIQAGAIMDFTADLLSAWIYKANSTHFYLPGHPILLHSLSSRGLLKRQRQMSSRGLLYQKIQASFWKCLCDNFSKSDTKFIDICNPMSPSYEPEIETGDQVAGYDGDYREPYATRLYLVLETKYAKTEALDALRVAKECEMSLSQIHRPDWDFEKLTEDFSEKWRALDNGRKTQNPEFHGCMCLLTFLQESKIPLWKTYANLYFLQHNQDPKYYVMKSLLESLHSHYRLQTHALHGSAPSAEARLVRFKKMKEKKMVKILTAKAVVRLLERNNICIPCNGDRVVPGHRHWQIETAVWNWVGFFTEGSETRWQRFGQFLDDF